MRFTGRRETILCCATALLLSGVSGAALAQSATPGSSIVLDTINVQGDSGRGVAPDGAPVNTIRERFDAMPGGVALVNSSEFPDTANLTVSRALSSVPGVVVQDFFGGNDQPRIQIRGSGLQQNPVERGVLVLQDGLPINRADGSYIVGLANPRQAQSIEVYRGYMANRLGATVLGGALNFVSPTGSSAPGSQITVSGGSFGQGGVAAQTGYRGENYDALLQIDATRRDGFRVYNQSQRVGVNANAGARINDYISTRIFAGYTDLGFDVAGPLTKDGLYANPRQVHIGPTVTPSGAINPGPNVVRDRPRREASQFLVGSRTTATYDAHLIDVALGYTYTDDMFRFPVSAGVRTTHGGDFTGLVRYAYKPNVASALPLFETTAQYTVGSADRGYYFNQSGVKGAAFGDNTLDATTLSLNAGFNIPLWHDVTLSPAISYSYATRDNSDNWRASQRPTMSYNPANPTMLLPNGAVPTESTSYSRSYSGWSPSLGLSYRPTADQTLFAAVSRSFEPPTHDDLLATINGTPNSSPGRPTPPMPTLAASAFRTPALDAQTATTVEAGWRGRRGDLSWDAVAYYSWVRNELLSLRDVTGVSLGAINADKTVHAGLELGLGARLSEQFTGRIVYTFQDFHFEDDPLRGNNRLAGAPRHLIHAMLQWQPNSDWRVQGALRWSPQRTPVDNMNTLFADPYAVVDLRAEYRINETFTVFGEITNLFDKTYASSTLIVDQARPDQAAFLPGDGRAFYAGIKARF
ncbi:MAG TPA: TonB-dependent receptor [Pseudolabrys sp.]|nr:TonB-dependent receptor [Pseudolabrys sp.]